MFDRLANQRDHWLERNRYFYDNDREFMRFLISPGASVLEIGCGEGQLLRALKPSRGVGIDISEQMIRLARERAPTYDFYVGNGEDPTVLGKITGEFDYIVISDTIGYLEDCEAAFGELRRFCNPRTRLIIAYYSHLWESILRAGEWIGQKMPSIEQNWLSTDDIVHLLRLADYEAVRLEWRQLLPKRLLGLGTVINKYVASLPAVRRLCLRNYVVARPVNLAVAPDQPPSCSVVIPCRNERGNIEELVRRLPNFAPAVEILFVEGHSRDGTYAECLRVRDAYPLRNVRVFQQSGSGKGDAVRLGFSEAKGDIVMILDADLTVAPETMPKFYNVIASGHGEFANGTRLVYPMAKQAMRHLNAAANRAFAVIFSYLLNQRFTDTLCGTKALWRVDYERIAAGRGYFGEFDPFGDFDLIFGAAKLNLKIVDVPVRYGDRTYGETQISRFRDGWMLLRMLIFAWKKLKAF